MMSGGESRADGASLTGALFLDMVRGGAANLYRERADINELNVFPIPDGDTGDNMYMTIRAGTQATDGAGVLQKVASEIAQGMLLGARGNSGVILSRIFSGIAAGFGERETADAAAFCAALRQGVKEAYGAVSVPVEGTILTVYREAAEYAGGHLSGGGIDEVLSLFCEEAARSLERTPELLAVLKEAGVVDSGGAGLVSIFEGMRSGEGELPEAAAEKGKGPDLSLFTEDSELIYGYCTEFLLRLQRRKTEMDCFDIAAFTQELNALGDSVVAFRDGSIVKVHVHTKTPGDILALGQRYGEFLTVKIENMTLQHHGMEEKKQSRKPHRKYAVVAVAAGDGIRETFRSMGADAVVDGGQTMNPSAADFIRAFEDCNADHIFVFPGDSNIILTAEQAGALYEKAQVFVLPCRSLGEIYVSLSMLDLSADTPDGVIASANAALEGVVCANVSRAVRDAEMNGVRAKKDEYIGYGAGKLLAAAATREQAVLDLAAALDAGRYDVALLIRGRDADENQARELSETLEGLYRRTEVVLLDGGQPVQDYIFVLE